MAFDALSTSWFWVSFLQFMFFKVLSVELLLNSVRILLLLLFTTKMKVFYILIWFFRSMPSFFTFAQLEEIGYDYDTGRPFSSLLRYRALLHRGRTYTHHWRELCRTVCCWWVLVAILFCFSYLRRPIHLYFYFFIIVSPLLRFINAGGSWFFVRRYLKAVRYLIYFTTFKRSTFRET